MHSNIIRVYTAGNVDDGKSTLIGSLLYQTGSVTIDKWEEIVRLSRLKQKGRVDLSLLTDGLIAEREKGITIDVAHLYFATEKKRFILSDNPGHKVFTRNMITGASSSDVAIIMIDARNGIQEQTLRHAFITALIHPDNVIFCVNKMDLFGYDEKVFLAIKESFAPYLSFFKDINVFWIPVSALWGENIRDKSTKMNWYQGVSLLSILENTKTEVNNPHFRFQVQHISQKQPDCFAGIVLNGGLKAGDTVYAFPDKSPTQITEIYKNGEIISSASKGMSVMLRATETTLLKRGSLLSDRSSELLATTTLRADLCWLDKTPLEKNKWYLLKNGSTLIPAKIITVEYSLNIFHFSKESPPLTVEMNDIVGVLILTETLSGLEPYANCKANGTFILIDRDTFNTLAVGFVTSR